jgi:5'-3' exonuclease
MGIPGFFRNIVTKIPKSHFWNKDTKIDFLFLDFNSIIYTSAANVSKMKIWNFKSNKDTKDFEKTLIDYIIDDTKNLVNNIIKPTRLIYIAIDGVPPLTKMRQQRERRAKPMIMKEMEKKYFPETYLENASWDKTKITPGTEFMYNLCTEFKRQIDKKAFKKLDVVFSGADIPGEAEHKYLSFIKRIDPKKDDVYCVYSNDADQIVLLLQFPNKKFYILHDITADLEDKYPDDQRFVYLDIQKFSGEIFTIFDLRHTKVQW